MSTKDNLINTLESLECLLYIKTKLEFLKGVKNLSICCFLNLFVVVLGFHLQNVPL